MLPKREIDRRVWPSVVGRVAALVRGQLFWLTITVIIRTEESS